MTRFSLMAASLVLVMGGIAQAQSAKPSASISGTIKHSTGLATPPPGTLPPQPQSMDHSNASVLGNNTPTLPQIALHPTATVGSSVPIAGPGGTTRNATGN